METKNIQEIVNIFDASQLTSLEITEGDRTIKLKRELTAAAHVSAVLPTPVAAVAAPTAPQAVDTIDFNKLHEVTSPLVGVFYSAPSPDAPPFVTIGSKVSKGDILCIIETMKLMNEVAADTDGEIVDICVKNGDIAEYGQVLFKII